MADPTELPAPAEIVEQTNKEIDDLKAANVKLDELCQAQAQTIQQQQDAIAQMTDMLGKMTARVIHLAEAIGRLMG